MSTVATNVLHCLIGCAVFPEMHTLAADTTPLHAMSMAASSNGVAWLIFYSHFSTLPFRWVL